MRHHFGDLLDRDGDYWTIIPNIDRYAYRIGDVPSGSKQVTIVTVGKEDEHWSRVLTLPNLDELTLHAPTPAQVAAIGELRSIKRLRITHARPRSLEFIKSMRSVEELVLEYVSGFSDLSPLQKLKRLRALHIENLRGVSNFSGLSGIASLRYLSINGTLDWKQPIFPPATVFPCFAGSLPRSITAAPAMFGGRCSSRPEFCRSSTRAFAKWSIDRW